MAAGSIIIDLLMRTGSFETDTARATKAAEKRFQELKKEAEGLGIAFGASFTAVAAATALLVKSSVDAMDALSDMAQQTGASTEALSALTYAASFGAVEQQTLVASLTKLNRTMFESQDASSEAARAFAALGVSATDADGKLRTSDQVLVDIADRLSKMKDGAQKTALAVAFFGKSGADLIPFLNQGAEGIARFTAEAEQLGLVVSQDVADAAGDLNDNLDRLNAAVAGLGNRLATTALPVLGDLSVMLVELAKNEASVSTITAVVEAAFSSLLAVFQTVAVVGTDVGFVFLGVGREIAAWAAQLQAVASGDLAGFRAISDAVKEDGERARAELDKFQARIMTLGQGQGGSGGLMGPPAALAGGGGAVNFRPKGSGSSGKEKQSEFERYLDGLNRQLERTQDLSAAEKVLADIQAKRLKDVSASQAGQLLDLAGQIDAAKQLEQEQKSQEESAKALAAAQKQLASEVKGLYDSTRTPVEQYAGRLQRLNELLEAGRIDADLYRRAMNQANEDLVAATKQADEAGDSMSEFSKRAQQNIQDALGNTLESALAGNFQSIGTMWLQLIQKMVAQALAARLNEALFGSGGNGFGDALKGIFGVVSGSGTGTGVGNAGFGDYKSFFDALPAHATGLDYVPHDDYVARLHKGEAVVRAQDNPAAGGRGWGTSFDFSGQTIVVGDGASMGQVKAAVQAGNAQTEARIRRSLQQKGYA